MFFETGCNDFGDLIDEKQYPIRYPIRGVFMANLPLKQKFYALCYIGECLLYKYLSSFNRLESIRTARRVNLYQMQQIRPQ